MGPFETSLTQAVRSPRPLLGISDLRTNSYSECVCVCVNPCLEGDTSRAKVLNKRCFNPNKHRAKKIVCFANKNEGFKPRLPGPRGGGGGTN